MKAIIDTGSNSVRLAVFADGQIVFKRKFITRLGKGLFSSGLLDITGKQKTLEALVSLTDIAEKMGVEKKDIYIFATAAVRRAKNGGEFVDEAYKLIGIKIDVVSEEEEAELALMGALGNDDGCVLDIGGASSELIVRNGGKIVYKHSLPLGAVVVTDMFQKDERAADEHIKTAVKEYEKVPITGLLTGIGGTASCCARVMTRIKGADYDGTDNKTVTLKELISLEKVFYSSSDEELERMGVEPQRTCIIAGGVTLLRNILEYLDRDKYVCSENDNLLGYYRLKAGGERR
ncbi:MAG: hypothetical protein J5762_02885 [Clostridia bacterium]|nr:hypothetical protein [Clostridia bacterium]